MKRMGKHMQTIIFATGNENKMKEIRMILGDCGAQIRSMKEAGVKADVDENGASFEENAVIKAREIAKAVHAGLPEAIVMADDSGLEIDALGKEPGIYSARYMGEETPYSVKNRALIERLDGIADERRTARFVCVIAAVFPDGTCITTRGVMEGRIGYEERGENGFGYDPIFVLPGYGCTTAELAPEVKNAESHRGRALRAMRRELVKRAVLSEKDNVG